MKTRNADELKKIIFDLKLIIRSKDQEIVILNQEKY